MSRNDMVTAQCVPVNINYDYKAQFDISCVTLIDCYLLICVALVYMSTYCDGGGKKHSEDFDRLTHSQLP
jgi:hypothetical protein